MYRKKGDFEKIRLCLMHIICAAASICFAYWVTSNKNVKLNAIIVILVCGVTYFFSAIYKNMEKRGYLKEFKAVFIYDIYILLLLTLTIFLTENTFYITRRCMAIFIMTDFVLIYVVHTIIKKYNQIIYPKISSSIKVYLVTTKNSVYRAIEALEKDGPWGGEVVGIALLDSSEIGSRITGIPVVADEDSLLNFAKFAVVDEVLIYLPKDADDQWLERMIMDFQDMGAAVSVNLYPFQMDIPSDKAVRRVGGMNVVTFTNRFYDYRYIVIKRIIDTLGSIVGLAITALVSIFVIPAIKLESPGPAIFSQERVGRNGRIFKFYKFRSMYADAEAKKAQLMENNEMSGPMFKMKNDPRITKVGKFLRATSIDELPQFFNVLKGDMSLVGTRPPTVQEYKQYKMHQKRRLSSKPGITGLWQVSGRSDITDFEEVVKLDLKYIDNWSLGMDIKILFKTFQAVLGQGGAR
jgi:exopolysaccharide biosynthesis polyprenyl glycosylphosphotransferase